MRLIDADELSKRLIDSIEYLKNQHYETYASVGDSIKFVIDNQQTAYSVDKVVEELEEVKTINVDVGYGTIYKTIRKDVAIEIIKQCGVSDDVCEWKRDDMLHTVYKICGGCFTSVYQKDFKYCPYCGKRIKIVGD